MASQNNNQDETAIDKMNSQLTEAGTKIANNKKYIYWGVGAILLVGVFVISYLFIYKNPRVDKAFDAYNNVQIESVGSDSIAAEKYREVADQYKGDDAGNLAALSAAEAYFSQGNYEKAAEYLKRFNSKDDVLAANALVLTGDCYVNLKKYDDAIEYYEKAVRRADGNDQIVPRVLLKEANVYDELKKYEKALQCYTTIQEKFPQFTLGNGVGLEAFIEREKMRLEK